MDVKFFLDIERVNYWIVNVKLISTVKVEIF